MYAKARIAQIKDLTGIDNLFEEPDNVDIIVENYKQTVKETKTIIIDTSEKMNYLSN